MPTFTVHQPPLHTRDSADPERFVFVRDGFYFWAFVLTGLWMLVHRLWLVLAGYIALMIALGGILALLNAPTAVHVFVDLLVMLLVGFEAATLWRWTLSRRGWAFSGFAVGDDVEDAERRFFSAWSKNVTTRKSAAPPQEPPATFAMPIRRGAPSPSDIIGLFPEPGAKS
jgi:hypothetical protein